jgi:O-antigen ligase
MQSKGSYISILLLLFYYFIFFKDKIKKKIIVLFAVLILPIISFETLLKIKIEYIKKNEFSKINNVKSRFFSNNSIEVDGKIIEDYTTGRFEIWKRAIKKIKEEKIFLGKGPQSDRFLLTSINFDPKIPRHFYDSNASNGLIYSYLCAGIIGLLFILTVYSLIFYEVYKSIFIKKAFTNKNSYVIFSIITLSFLSVRTIYENGFTYFGIDYVFTAICYLILKKFNSIRNTKNYFIL